MIFVFATCALSQAHGQQTFSHLSIDKVQRREVINFSVPRETNVRHYRVEASNDNNNYEVIGTVKAAGNSVLARDYHFDLTGFKYKYYRLGIVGVTSLQYSPVLSLPSGVQRAPGSEKEIHGESNVITSR